MPNSAREKVSLPLTALKGFAMGCADVVPGVSGGTVALVVGIYDRLVAGIQSVVAGLSLMARFRFKDGLAQMDLGFLIPLLSGIAIAIVSMAKLITKAMVEIPELTWGLFLGLMIGSVILVGRSITEKRIHLTCITICSALFSALVTSSAPVETPESPVLFFIAGCVAIVAMILPGISGSFLLLIMGKYVQVLEALNGLKAAVMLYATSLMHGDHGAMMEAWQNIVELGTGVIVPFILGCCVGLAAFSWILNLLLKYYRNMMMSALLGLMIGSLHKLWPFREITAYIHHAGKPDKILQDIAVGPYWGDPMDMSALGLIALGVVVVMGIDWWSGRKRG